MAGRILFRWRWAVGLLGIAGSLGLLACAPETLPDTPPSTERDWPVAQLHEGGHIAAELTPEETHRWRLPLEAGDFLRLVVEQDGVDVELTWLDPAGEVVLTADRYINDRGPELVLTVAETAGEHTLSIEAFPGEAGRYEARVEALRPATDGDRLAARTYRRFRQVGLPRREEPFRQEATGVWLEALDVWRELGEPVLEGEVLWRLGQDHYLHGEWAEAADRFGQAARAFDRGGPRRWEALARSKAAINLWALGEPEAAERAAEQYRTTLALARDIGDPLLEADALNALGQAHRRWGDVQEALARYEAALEVLPEGDELQPQVLHNLGVLHSLYFHDHARATEFLEAALAAWSPGLPTYAWRKASTLNQLGRVALEQGNPEDARQHFEASLELREGEDPCGRALTLARLARIEEGMGRSGEAVARRDRALELVHRESCPRHEPPVRIVVAEMAAERRDLAAALEGFETARRLAEDLRDRTVLAESWVGIARIRRARGDMEAALEASRRALELTQGVRPTVLREDLRTAFFATVQDRFDLHLALLTELGRHREAWAVAEAARAQALRDLLTEAGAGLRQVAEPEIVERERRLRRRLSYAEWRGLDRERVDGLLEELERVRAEIRRRSPRYAELTRPRPLNAQDVQRDLLEDDTLLLEYRLGSEESWLWAMDRDGFSVHVLPPRGEIEPLAREAAGWLRSLEWPGENPPVLCELSRKVLGPVAAELGSRRLVLVPDGALEAVPFAALPDPSRGPCAQAPPLVAKHEIVSLPSVGTLAAQRRRHGDRPPAPRGVAVVADPVYGPEDPRHPRQETRPAASAIPAPRRLVHSGAEAEAIRELAPRRVDVALGFEASKEAVLQGSLADYRVLHFAVHGVLDPDRPLLSHLALSRYTRGGERVDGALYAHEIYDLDLPAELAVLSACDTARGRWVAGEGLVAGLPRAFLYAGAERVLVSLWAVPDRSTRRLMEGFYQRLLEDRQPPARALRDAQREQWQAGRPPRQWAGFILQGDWRPLPAWDR